MSKDLKHSDIREAMNNWTSLIMRDQIFADGLSSESVHPQYNGDMWRTYRLDHLAFLNELSATVNAIPPAMLKRLTQIANEETPSVIGQVTLEVLSECASGSAPREDVRTAPLFFDRLIHELDFRKKAISSKHKSAKSSMFSWLSATDPLRIGCDPECGYSNAPNG